LKIRIFAPDRVSCRALVLLLFYAVFLVTPTPFAPNLQTDNMTCFAN